MSDAFQSGAGRAGVSEFDAIRRWSGALPTTGPGVRLGPGDDVAVVDAGGPVAVSTDAVVEGTHFDRERFAPEDVGWKALAAALSDLAAARAEPVAAVVSLTAPRFDAWTDALMRGLGDCAVAFRCPVVGGDTTRGAGPVVVSVTVLGRGGRALTRAGARQGHQILLSGECGWAAAGLAGLDHPRARAALLRPRPRLDLLDALGDATAAIDISDGLLADAAHVAEASGVTLVLGRDALVSEALRSAAGPDASAYACRGGEDYELLVCAPGPLPGFTVVGRVEARGDVDLRWSSGAAIPQAGRGWDHGDGP